MKNVTGKGHMDASGYVPENERHWDRLIKDGKGINPLDIDPAVLTECGHGPRRTSTLVAALGDVDTVDGLVRAKDLRRQCLSCAETVSGVRDCAIIDCPLWSMRMGKNPHHPRRGVNPFARNAA